MDLTLLPDEMLIRVASYLKPEVLVHIRKINHRFCQIIERYGLHTLLPVRQCSISGNLNRSAIFFTLVIDKAVASAYGIKPHHRIQCIEDDTTKAELLDRLICKVKISDISFIAPPAFLSINNNEINVLLKHKSSLNQCRNLSFQGVNFNCAEEKIGNLIGQMKKLDSLMLIDIENSIHRIFNFKILEKRKWKCLVFKTNGLFKTNETNRSQMPEKEFLSKVVRNCRTFSVPDEISCEVNYSFQEICDELQLLDFYSDIELDWNLGIIHCPEVETIPERIKELPGLEVAFDDGFYRAPGGWRKCRHFKITSKFNRTVIQFIAYMIPDE